MYGKSATSFTQHGNFESHPCYCIYPEFLFVLCSVPLYECTLFCLFMQLLIGMWVVSSLGLLLKVSSSAQVSMCRYVYILLGQIPRSGMAASQVELNFLRNCQTIF